MAQLLGEFKGDLTSDVTHLVAQEVAQRRTAQPASAFHRQMRSSGGRSVHNCANAVGNKP